MNTKGSKFKIAEGYSTTQLHQTQLEYLSAEKYQRNEVTRMKERCTFVALLEPTTVEACPTPVMRPTSSKIKPEMAMKKTVNETAGISNVDA